MNPNRKATLSLILNATMTGILLVLLFDSKSETELELFLAGTAIVVNIVFAVLIIFFQGKEIEL